MSAIWNVVRPFIGPLLVSIAFLLAFWVGVQHGTSLGRAEYADDIAACEQRRVDDYTKLITDRETILAERTEALAASVKKFEEIKHENEKLRERVKKTDSENNARHAALDAAFASMRFRESGASSDFSVPRTATTTGESDAAASEYRACTTELDAVSRRAGHDAMTILEWQSFYGGLFKK